MTRTGAGDGTGGTGGLALDYGAGALSKDVPGEHERLRLLQEWGDPDTRAVIEAAGPAPDWRCLEIGAGAGSVARWLAGRCPSGDVLAVDTDIRYRSDDDPPNLRWRAADVRELDLEPGSLDLVHARLVLSHLPQRAAVLAAAARWLAPGGVLAVGDPMCVPAAWSVHPPLVRFFTALERGWAAQGSDMTTWATTLPAQLAAVGLREVSVVTRANRLGDPGPYGRLAVANIVQEGAYLVSHGLLAPEDVEAALALCRDPAVTDLRSITVYAWGRRQSGDGTDR